MKKLFLLTLSIYLFGAMQIDSITPKKIKRVYLGSFLAIAYLPSKSRYVIDAPVEGIIENIGVKIYQKVKKGSKLVVIKSPTILELEADFIQTLIERDYYLNELKRLKPLYQEAVIAKKVYLKALNEYKKYQTKVKFYTNLLQSWGLEKKQVNKIISSKKPIPSIIIKAPIDGEVADLDVSFKSYVQRGDHILTIIDPSNTHYQVLLPLNIASKLKQNETVYVNNIKTKVESIAPVVESQTQTVAVHLLPLQKVSLLPNQKVNIKLYLKKEAYLVPNSAVVQKDGVYGVYVKKGDNFIFKKINILSNGEQGVYIEADFSPNTKIAVSNVVVLKQREQE